MQAGERPVPERIAALTGRQPIAPGNEERNHQQGEESRGKTWTDNKDNKSGSPALASVPQSLTITAPM